MKKRLFALLLTAALLFTLLPQTVLFASAGTNSGTCGENLEWSFDEATGTLTITGSGAMDDWPDSTAAPWYPYSSSIKYVSLSKGLTSIGEGAFDSYTGLTAISIPDSVTSIGDRAFICTGLKSITIPDSVKSIGDMAFYFCSSLTSIEIGDGVTSIGSYAFISTAFFNNSENWTNDALFINNYLIAVKSSLSGEYEIPEGTKLLADSVFNSCYGLTGITIPDSLTSIGNDTFNYCFNLKSITIPDSVSNIGLGAFCNCSNLADITIGNGVTSIGYDAFSGTDFYNNEDNWTDDILFINNYLIAAKSSLSGEYEIPEGTKLLAGSAFKDCSALTVITIPDSVVSIGENAFYNCSSLTDITIPDGVTSIASGAFSNCSSLTDITLPDSVTSIGEWAFYGCTGLTDVYYPGTEEEWNAIDIDDGNDPLANATIHFGQTEADPIETDSGTCGDNLSWSYNSSTHTLTITGSGAMKNWSYDSDVPWYSYRSSIQSVSLPDGLTSIGSEAFYGCTGLTAISIPDSVTSIGDSAFYGCTGLTSITVAEGNPVYDSRNNCNAIIETATNTLIAGCKNTVIPDSVTSIGYYAFCDCTGLTAITIPDSVTAISDYAFYGCTGLTAISIPDGVTAISDYAFVGCTGLTSITVAEGNPVYDSRNNCNAIIETATNTLIAGCKNTVIPDSVTSIGDSAFAGCTGLTGITIPSGVTAISDGAFADCTGLTAISIPDSVTSIGWGAFYGCTGLTAIAIPDSVTSIGEQAFNGCTGLTSITVAEGNPVYDSRNNCNAIIETATNTLIAGCKNTVIPSGVTAISDGAFADCTGLTAISIPDSVTSIGWGAFYGCTGLTAISVGNGVTSIDYYAFYDCTGLTSITVAEGNPVYDSRNNCNAIIETATNTLIAGCKSTVIPDSVTAISDCAFVHCTGLTNITIPDSVTSICDEAFYGCTGLTAITIGNGVTSIGYYAFKDCTGLTDVYYPGTEEEWNAICIDGENDPLANATIHFGQTEADPCDGYTDIDRGSWYHSAADFVIERGLMGSTKTDALTFEPNTKVSRAMVASILYRMADSPAVEYKATFTDVPADKWFTNAIEWCAQNGLASGKGNGKFDPNGNVTRQELAVFMMKMAEYLGEDTSGRADLGIFADAGKVPAWAKTYLEWAVNAGLISGKANGGKTYLAPTDNATRAEFASIIMRFVQNIAEAK